MSLGTLTMMAFTH